MSSKHRKTVARTPISPNDNRKVPPPSESEIMRTARRPIVAALAACATWLPAATYAQQDNQGYSIAGADMNSRLRFEERSGTVMVNVSRLGDFNVPSSVHYSVTTNSGYWRRGAATPGLDFVLTEGTLDFDATATNKIFTIALIDDNLIEGGEDFFIVLDQATGGVPIDTPDVRVVIGDDERNPARVDPDFKPDWPAARFYWPECVCAVQADGKVLLVTPSERVTGEDGTMVVRLLPEGQLDPAWQPAIISGSVHRLHCLTDGQTLIGGLYGRYSDPWRFSFMVNGILHNHLARLNADGTLDASFATSFATNLSVGGLTIQPSTGQILVAMVESVTEGSYMTFRTTLFRLDSSGNSDPSFPSVMLPFYPGTLTANAAGIIVTAWDGSSPTRLRHDGTIDGTFKPPPDARFKATLPDGRMMVTLLTNTVYVLARLTVDGQLDPTFTLISNAISQVLPAKEGKVWTFESFDSPDEDGLLSRLNLDGSPDVTWPVATIRGMRNPFDLDARLMMLPDGNLLVVGIPFGEINGQPRRSLARLLVHTPLPRIEVDPNSARVPENGGKVSITALRCGTNTEPSSVNWRTEGGTAEPGLDYVLANGTITFLANESSATFELLIVDNAVPDEDRSVRLRLQSQAHMSQEYPMVEITIVNDDLGFLPGGIHRFPNGRVLLCPAGRYDANSPLFGGPINFVDTSENLRDWAEMGYYSACCPELLDNPAPTNTARFYRLRSSW